MMSDQMLTDLEVLRPEIYLVCAIVATVIADLVFSTRGRAIVGVLALTGIGFALCSLMDPADANVRTFGLLKVDGFANFFRFLIIGGTGVVILHGVCFRGMEDSSRNEFVPMLLGTALGGCLLVSTDHLLMLLLSLELLSLNSYLLAGWQRRERRSSEAALKYLVFGALASALMVFGFSLLFGISGSLSMPEIGAAVSAAWAGNLESQLVVIIATVLVLAGMGFKIAVFPFHFWAPDVYEGAPTPVTTFLAVGSKAAGFGVLLRFLDGVYLGEALNAEWLPRMSGVLAVLAAVTMTYGNVTAILQRNVKRLMAYSSIAHAGYLLMGVAIMTSASENNTGLDASLFYLATYYLATLGAFGCLMSLANRFGAEDTEDLQGLGWSAPFTCAMLVLFLVSLTGLPPTAGFVGKLMLFRAAIDSGLGWLAVVGALNAAVALCYYFKIVRSVYLRGDHEYVDGLPNPGLLPMAAQASLGVLGVATVYFGLGFDSLAEWVGGALL
jgi:NADH-quinone oxidoreductase subunit N